MDYLLDATACSDLMREDPGTLMRLARLQEADRVFSCVIAWGEILFGIERLMPGRRRQELEIRAYQLLTRLTVEPVPVSAADHYRRIKIGRERFGLATGENDLWIAATALSLHATLVSRDSDFTNINGLTVENWNG
jgi:predicted nucleic acid-binding protein